MYNLSEAEKAIALAVTPVAAQLDAARAGLAKLKEENDKLRTKLEASDKLARELEGTVAKYEARIDELERLVNKQYPDTPSDVEPE